MGCKLVKDQRPRLVRLRFVLSILLDIHVQVVTLQVGCTGSVAGLSELALARILAGRHNGTTRNLVVVSVGSQHLR